MAAPVDDLVLPVGQVVTLLLDGRAVSVWWGPDGDRDRVAVRGGRVLTWPTAEAAGHHARQAGRRGGFVAAHLPYVFDLDVFRPRWTAGELRVLRAVLDRAVHVLRAALT